MRREILSDVDTDNEDQSSDSGDNNEESEEDTILSNEDGEDESEDESAEEDDDEPELGDAESEDESVGNTGWADAMAKVALCRMHNFTSSLQIRPVGSYANETG